MEGHALIASVYVDMFGRIFGCAHVCGHVHEGHGIFDVREPQKKLGDKTTPAIINASYVNEKYEPVNATIRVIF